MGSRRSRGLEGVLEGSGHPPEVPGVPEVLEGPNDPGSPRGPGRPGVSGLGPTFPPCLNVSYSKLSGKFITIHYVEGI